LTLSAATDDGANAGREQSTQALSLAMLDGARLLGGDALVNFVGIENCIRS
jgi:hypothetical protein